MHRRRAGGNGGLRVSTMAAKSNPRSKDYQVGCNLEKGIAERLESYAAACEVSRSKLLGLLIVRELNETRLEQLKVLVDGSDDRSEAVRVTGRLTSSKRRDAFRTQVGELGMRLEDGLAILARIELMERWLAASLKTPESELILVMGGLE